MKIILLLLLLLLLLDRITWMELKAKAQASSPEGLRMQGEVYDAAVQTRNNAVFYTDASILQLVEIGNRQVWTLDDFGLCIRISSRLPTWQRIATKTFKAGQQEKRHAATHLANFNFQIRGYQYSTTVRNRNRVNRNLLEICLSSSKKKEPACFGSAVIMPTLSVCPTSILTHIKSRPNLELASGNCES